MRHLKAFQMVFAAGILFIVAGCSSSPSQGDGKQAIESRIKEESQGRIKLTKFQKNNGVQGELMGFKIYALEFEAEIEFTENCKWVTGFQGSQLSFRTGKPMAEPPSGFSWNKFLDDTQSPGELMAKGQKVSISGLVRFVKKEKGWAVDGVDLKNSTPVNGSVSAPPPESPALDSSVALTAQGKTTERNAKKSAEDHAAQVASSPTDPVASVVSFKSVTVTV